MTCIVFPNNAIYNKQNLTIRILKGSNSIDLCGNNYNILPCLVKYGTFLLIHTVTPSINCVESIRTLTEFG